LTFPRKFVLNIRQNETGFFPGFVLVDNCVSAKVSRNSHYPPTPTAFTASARLDLLGKLQLWLKRSSRFYLASALTVVSALSWPIGAQ
jgi:hypothetical protein